MAPENNGLIAESLEKLIAIPKCLHPHLHWWLKEENVLSGQPLHPLCYAIQIFTDALNEGWGTHSGDCTTKAFGPFQKQTTHKLPATVVH